MDNCLRRNARTSTTYPAPLTDSPERDRIGTVQEHIEWLNEVGFESVDHIWHHWFEHFFIAEKAVAR